MSGAEPVVRLAARGDGVTASGRYVPLTAPGDLIEADGTTTPGPHRQTPPCRHFPACGGCQVQQVDDEAFARFVVDRILWPLHQVGIEPRDVEPVHLSPPRSRRRAALRAVRQDRHILIGFAAEGTHRIIDMHECHVLRPALFELVAPLRAPLGPIMPRGGAVGVTMTETESGIDLLLSNVQADSLGTIQRLTSFAADHRLARLAIETAGGVETIVEPSTPTVRLGGAAVALPPASFLQATADGEVALQRAVQTIVGDSRVVADLFCGVGTFALPLAQQARVTAVDAAGPAVAAMARAARGAGLPLDPLHRDLFRRPLTPAELAGFDAAVIDPPRSGAVAQAGALAMSRVQAVAAVSCNPATFARDAAILARGGFRLTKVRPIGQFRWSTHVELVGAFAR